MWTTRPRIVIRGSDKIVSKTYNLEHHLGRLSWSRCWLNGHVRNVWSLSTCYILRTTHYWPQLTPKYKYKDDDIASTNTNSMKNTNLHLPHPTEDPLLTHPDPHIFEISPQQVLTFLVVASFNANNLISTESTTLHLKPSHPLLWRLVEVKLWNTCLVWAWAHNSRDLAQFTITGMSQVTILAAEHQAPLPSIPASHFSLSRAKCQKWQRPSPLTYQQTRSPTL